MYSTAEVFGYVRAALRNTQGTQAQAAHAIAQGAMVLPYMAGVVEDHVAEGTGYVPTPAQCRALALRCLARAGVRI